MPTGQRKHVVIIGAGFGGLKAAKALRGANVDVTLIDRTNHHLFQPLLYQVATAALSPGDIAQPIRSILRNATNIHVVMTTVEHIDTASRVVVCNDRVLSYDALIVAPGARHAYFGHDAWEEHAPGLKDLNDALHIREKILATFEAAEAVRGTEAMRRLLTFVVVGGGPTGVELAGAIAEISARTMLPDFPTLHRTDIRVVLVQAGDRVLETFDTDLSASAKRQLEALGVEVLTEHAVTDVTADGVHMGELFIPSANVIWAAGNAASPLLRTLQVPLDRAGRVIVQPDCSIPGHPEVFVIGDAARFDTVGGVLPGVCQTAMQMGVYVAKVIKRNLAPEERRPFVYKDLGSMATIGRAAAIAQIGRLKMGGVLAWFMWAGLHVAMLISFRNRFKVMIEWMWYYVSFQPGARLIVTPAAAREALPRHAGRSVPTSPPSTHQATT